MKRRLGMPPGDLEKVEGNLATLLAFRGAYEEAERIYRGVLARRREDYDAGDVDIATGLRNLGSLLYLKGELEAAEAALRESLALRQAVLGRASTSVASVAAVLGRVVHAGAARGGRGREPARRPSRGPRTVGAGGGLSAGELRDAAASAG